MSEICILTLNSSRKGFFYINFLHALISQLLSVLLEFNFPRIFNL